MYIYTLPGYPSSQIWKSKGQLWKPSFASLHPDRLLDGLPSHCRRWNPLRTSDPKHLHVFSWTFDRNVHDSTENKGSYHCVSSGQAEATKPVCYTMFLSFHPIWWSTQRECVECTMEALPKVCLRPRQELNSKARSMWCSWVREESTVTSLLYARITSFTRHHLGFTIVFGGNLQTARESAL